ncbi:MAG: hypothetical protein KAQ75_16535, partial [Bacteroidales bacterium]|nr:hypothetical protein [Bacteroidales bacterium]
MMGPLNILALLSFWGGVGRIFTLRQGKRLFGLIDTGQIFGAILSAFAIPILIAVGFQQKNLLFLSSVSVIGAFILQIIISIKFNLNKQVKTSEKKQKRLPELLKNKYILYMAIFVMMSMLAAFFVQYSFLSVTKENYPDHNDLTEFLGLFTGSLLLFTFLFKTFVYSKLMKTYGLKFSLIVSPFLIGLFTVGAAFIGSIWGYTTAAASFVFFFLVISLSRLFSKALKDSVEGPSFKILYQSLKAEIRHDVQAYVDGTINEVAALLAGLLLAALSLFKFFTLIHFSYSLIIILIIWFFAARKLYVEYKVSLQKSLAEFKGHKDDIEHISDLIYNKLDSDHSENPKIVPGLEIDCELHPQKFEDNISKLIKHKNSLVKNFTLNKIIEFKLVESISVLDDNEMKSELINETLNKIIHEAKVIDKSPGVEQIVNLAKSKSTDERVWAGYLISKFYQKDYFVYLKALMRDLSIPVKISGIRSATKLKLTDLCPLIIDYLDTLGVYTYANEALLAFGEKSLSYLDQVFYKTGTNHRILIRIVKLYGQIGGEKAKELLIKKLDHPNEEILYYVLLSLKQCDFKADESNINHIQHITEQHIGIMGWNIAAKLSLSETVSFEYLKDAVNEELEANYNYLYLLLSLAYDAKSIIHVKENIESGTSEGASYALELLDLFILDELKPKLFPVVEDISLIEKIKQLQNFYPIEKLSID